MNALANEPLLPSAGLRTKLEDGGDGEFREEKTVNGIGDRAVKLVNHRAALSRPRD